MQKLFKRSLAMVLSIMMVVTMFSGMTFASAETLEPFTEWTTGEASYTHLGVATATSSDGDWGNYRYVAQEFVPADATINGVKLGFNLTGGSAIMHIEIRKGDVNSEAIYTTEVPFYSRGNGNAMYEFGFDQEVAVTPGEVYYLAFWLADKVAGNICVVNGTDTGSANGAAHPAYMWAMSAGGDVTFSAGNANLITNFAILSGRGMNKLVHHVDTPEDITFHTGSYTGRGIDTEIKTEGVSSTFGWWNAGNAVESGTASTTNTSFRIPQGGIDFSKAKYFSMDIYKSGFEVDVFSGIGFGSEAAWQSRNLANIATDAVKEQIMNMKDGWNTIVVELGDTSSWGKVQNIWLAFDNDAAIRFTAEKPVIGYDNFRIYDETGYAMANYADEIAALEDQIDALDDLEYLVHNGDTLDNALNFSSPSNQAVVEGAGADGTGAIKYEQTQDGSQEHNLGFRIVDGVTAGAINAVQFDLYLSEGMAFNADGWGNLSVQTAHVTGGDTDLAGAQANVKIAMASYLANAKAGWNTITIPVNPDDDAVIKQICARFFSNFTGNTGEYIMVDNVKLLGPSGKTYTADDVDAVQAVKTAYDALPAAAQALVSNVATLNAAVDAVAQYIPMDLQFRAFANTNGINGGNGTQSRTTETVNVLEGSGAAKWEYTTETTSGIFWYVYCDNSSSSTGMNIRNAEYITFDLYVSDVTAWNLSGDTRINLRDTSDGWNSNCGQVPASNMNSTFKALKNGWNHIVLPLDRSTATNDMLWAFRMYFSTGTAPVGFYTIIDDIRFVNQLGLDTVIAKRTAAKDATLAIQAIPAVDTLTLDDKATVEAAATAYAVVDADYVSLVKGADTLTAAQAKITELETPVVTGPVIDGVKDEAYTDAKMLEISTAYAAVQGAETTNTLGTKAKVWYTWDDEFNYVFMEASGTYAYSPSSYDIVYYLNHTNGIEGNYMFSTAGGGYVQWDMQQSSTLAAPTTTSSNLVVAEAKNAVDTATMTPRYYEFKFARDAQADGFSISPVIQVGPSGSLAANEIIAYGANYNATDFKVVKYEDESTWYEKVPADPEEPEENIVDESMWNMDQIKGLAGTRAAKTTVDNKNFTQGTGSYTVDLNTENSFELLVYGTNENGSNANTNVQDISKFINADGEFYITFDMYVSDPAIVTKNRFMLGVGTYTEASTSIASTCLALNANTQSGKNATWADFGLAEGPKAGWNKIAIKMDCSEDSKYWGKGATYWDATAFRFIRLYADGFTVNASNVVKFDDVRFMTVDAYEANFAARNAAKDVVIAINDIADYTETEKITAARAAYNALTDDQKAMVSNEPKLAELEAGPPVPEDTQLSSMDTLAMIVIPGGNQATGGTQGKVYTSNYVEGTGSNFSNWGEKEVGAGLELRMGLVGLGGVDMSKYDYLVFDLYVHGLTHRWVAGANDCNIGFGAGNVWTSAELGMVGNSNLGPILDTLQEGWNHVVVPISITGSANVLQFYSTAATATATDPYVLFDDIRLVDEAGLTAEADRNAAKAVIAQIATLDAADAEAVAAATAAYNALTDAQKAYVTNYSVIEEINKAPADAQVVIDAINNIAGGNAIMFHDCENGDYAIDYTTNSSKSVAEGQGNGGGNALKFTQSAATTQEFSIAVGVPTAIPGEGVAAVKFDLYLSEGMSFASDAANWPSLAVKTESNASADAPLAAPKVALYDYLKDCKPGWNTITMPVSMNDGAAIKEIYIRIWKMFTGAPGEYLMLDNVQLVYAVNEITYADNALIDSVKAQYDALSAPAKALVTNVDVLNGYVAAMDAEEAAAATVVNAINALPPVSSEDPEADVLTIDDQAALTEATNAYNALAADTKAALVSAEVVAKLDAANARMKEIIEGSDLGTLVSPVVAAIDALPAVEDVRTSDETAINTANTLYNNLSDEAKTFMAENYAAQAAKLTAVTEELAVEKENEAAAKSTVDAIAALPTPAKAADEAAVNAVVEQYNALAADVQNYVTNKAVLDAAVASVAQDKADIAAAAALTEAVAGLPAEVTEADVEAVEAVKAQYDALTATGKTYVSEETKAALDTAYTASQMFGAIDVQYRAFDNLGPDAANDACKPTKVGLDKSNRLEGKSSYSMTWENDASGDIHIYVYHHKQGEGWTVDTYENEGSWLVPVPSTKTMNIVLDFYVSDADVLLKASGDCGFGFDALSANQWGNGGGANKAKLMAAFTAANNGEGLKDGWNSVVVPISFAKNFAGQIITVYDFRFYFCGATIPAGFTIKMDDVRFMNQEAVDTILPERVAAKNVTLAINALSAEYTYEEGKAVVAKYNDVAADYKDLVIGYDEFYAAYAEKYAEEIAAELAANIAAAQPVIDAIDALTKASDMFNDCETLTVDGFEVVANLNSGADDKSLAEGQGVDGGNAAKFTKKAAGKSEFNEVFRVVEPMDFMTAENLEFDLYIAEGMTIEPGWSPVYVQTGHSNDNDTNKIASIDMKDMMGAWKAGQWNHVVISLDSIPKVIRNNGIAQISIRLYHTLSGEAGDYIMIDNLILTGPKTITTADAEAIADANAKYEALTAEQKALVSNYDALTAANEALKAAQDAEAVAAVEEMINALPETIGVENKEAVEAAEAAYAKLTDDQKADVDAALVDKLAAARVALDAAVKAAADAEAAAAVDALIEAFPETVTPADAEQVNAAKAAYDALTEDQKVLVKAENKTALDAALKAIVAPEYTLGDLNNDGEVDAKDALMVLQIAVDKIEATETQRLAGDVNKDGEVNATDALNILKKAVGKPSCF